VALAVGVYFFPLFHVTPLRPQPTGGPIGSTATTAAAFDPTAAAAQIWQDALPSAAQRAVDLKVLLPVVRTDPAAARSKFAPSAGLGAAYFFVRGTGKIVQRERGSLRLAIDGDDTQVVAVRIGPIFGNSVRDGCGLLEVNAFPGLQEFNALSAALNTLVEKRVLPPLQAHGVVGATVTFAGCAEAPESAPEAGEPILTIVPVRAEVR
jgi:predicted lipoprotein